MTEQELLDILHNKMEISIIRNSIALDFSNCERLNMKRASGISKYCLIFPDFPYVIKIPKNITGKNYCQMEMDNYQLALQMRVDKVVPETKLFTVLDGKINCYLQKKVDTTVGNLNSFKQTKYSKITSQIKDEFIYKTRDSFHDRYSMNILWLKMVWMLYGEKFYRSLEEWTQKCQINDLHHENLGYTRDKPFLIDFSGY